MRILFVTVYQNHLKYFKCVGEMCHRRILGATPVNECLCRRMVTFRSFRKSVDACSWVAHSQDVLFTQPLPCGVFKVKQITFVML